MILVLIPSLLVLLVLPLVAVVHDRHVRSRPVPARTGHLADFDAVVAEHYGAMGAAA